MGAFPYAYPFRQPSQVEAECDIEHLAQGAQQTFLPPRFPDEGQRRQCAGVCHDIMACHKYRYKASLSGCRNTGCGDIVSGQCHSAALRQGAAAWECGGNEGRRAQGVLFGRGHERPHQQCPLSRMGDGCARLRIRRDESGEGCEDKFQQRDTSRGNRGTVPGGRRREGLYRRKGGRAVRFLRRTGMAGLIH